MTAECYMRLSMLRYICDCLLGFPIGGEQIAGDLKEYFPDLVSQLPKDLTMLKVDGKINSPYFDEATVFDGGSGLVSSTEDYLKFAQMLRKF